MNYTQSTTLISHIRISKFARAHPRKRFPRRERRPRETRLSSSFDSISFHPVVNCRASLEIDRESESLDRFHASIHAEIRSMARCSLGERNTPISFGLLTPSCISLVCADNISNRLVCRPISDPTLRSLFLESLGNFDRASSFIRGISFRSRTSGRTIELNF